MRRLWGASHLPARHGGGGIDYCFVSHQCRWRSTAPDRPTPNSVHSWQPTATSREASPLRPRCGRGRSGVLPHLRRSLRSGAQRSCSPRRASRTHCYSLGSRRDRRSCAMCPPTCLLICASPWPSGGSSPRCSCSSGRCVLRCSAMPTARGCSTRRTRRSHCGARGARARRASCARLSGTSASVRPRTSWPTGVGVTSSSRACRHTRRSSAASTARSAARHSGWARRFSPTLTARRARIGATASASARSGCVRSGRTIWRST